MVTEDENKAHQQEEEEEKGDNRRGMRIQSKRKWTTDTPSMPSRTTHFEESTSRTNSEPPSTQLTRRHCVLHGRAPFTVKGGISESSISSD